MRLFLGLVAFVATFKCPFSLEPFGVQNTDFSTDRAPLALGPAIGAPRPSAQRMIDLAEPKLKPAEILTEDAPQVDTCG